MTKRRDAKGLTLGALRQQNYQTIGDITQKTGISKEAVRQALRTLIAHGYAHKTQMVRKFPSYECHIFALGPSETDEEPDEPMMHVRERTKAIEDTARTIQGLRSAFIPGQFDPFRVLRAQVGGMA